MATGASTIPGNLTAVRPPQMTQVDDLLRLQKAAHKITSILDLDQLIDMVVNEVARSFGCVEADVYLHDEVRGAMTLAHGNGCAGCEICGKGHGLKIGKDGMVGYVAGTGQMRYAPDVRKDPNYIGCEESTLSEVAIPLHVDWEGDWSVYGFASRTGCVSG
jgi:sigma-B regulation protein RsbU (phosphoserine phosphatase)